LETTGFEGELPVTIDRDITFTLKSENIFGSESRDITVRAYPTPVLTLIPTATPAYERAIEFDIHTDAPQLDMQIEVPVPDIKFPEFQSPAALFNQMRSNPANLNFSIYTLYERLRKRLPWY
jgi:hypothetical protein